jgi:hypothetical protein
LAAGGLSEDLLHDISTTIKDVVANTRAVFIIEAKVRFKSSKAQLFPFI